MIGKSTSKFLIWYQGSADKVYSLYIEWDDGRVCRYHACITIGSRPTMAAMNSNMQALSAVILGGAGLSGGRGTILELSSSHGVVHIDYR